MRRQVQKALFLSLFLTLVMCLTIAPAVFAAGLSVLPLESPSCRTDEERRLLYVGMTRAGEELILTSGPESSPFLSALPDSVERKILAQRQRPMEQFRLF